MLYHRRFLAFAPNVLNEWGRRKGREMGGGGEQVFVRVLLLGVCYDANYSMHGTLYNFICVRGTDELFQRSVGIRFLRRLSEKEGSYSVKL